MKIFGRYNKYGNIFIIQLSNLLGYKTEKRHNDISINIKKWLFVRISQKFKNKCLLSIFAR